MLWILGYKILVRSQYCNTLFRETEKEDKKVFVRAAEGNGFRIQRMESGVWKDDVLKMHLNWQGLT